MNKKSTLMILVMIFSILFMSSCATVSTRGTSALPTKEFFVNGGYDKVWKITTGVVAENYPISILNKESGLITTEVKGIPSTTMKKIAICPESWGCWMYEDGRARINVMLSEEDSTKTRVRITPYLEWYKSSDEEWKVIDPAPAFYDDIVEETLRRSPTKVE